MPKQVITKKSISKFAAAAVVFLSAASSSLAGPINAPLQAAGRSVLTAEAAVGASVLQTVASLSPRVSLLAHMLPFYPALGAQPETVDRDTLTATIAKPSMKVTGAKTRTNFAPGVFGSVAIGFGRLPAVAKLAAITGDADAMASAPCKGAGCSASRAAFVSMVGKLKGASFLSKVRSVNTLVNGFVTYRRDADTYGRPDYWASPAETLRRGAGDCEDYAILKMAMLQKLGVPARSMSVVILKDDRRNLFHAVLTVRTTQGNFVLDNVRSDVLVDRDLAHYTPLYSVSAGKGYIHGRRASDGRTAMSSIALDAVAPGEGP